jgi:hypothetical protein
VRRAADRAAIHKRVHPHVFRHYPELRIIPTMCWDRAFDGGLHERHAG